MACYHIDMFSGDGDQDDEASYGGPPWTCSLCTYYNYNSFYLTCGACGEVRPEQDRRGSTFNDEDLLNLSDSFREDIDKQEEMLERSIASITEEFASQDLSLKRFSDEGLRFPPCSFANISELQEHLDLDEAELIQEKENYEHMVMMLRRRRAEIEQSEGITMTEIGERATRPGACRVSPSAMDWLAQQQMVDEWALNLRAKEEELQAMRASLNI